MCCHAPPCYPIPTPHVNSFRNFLARHLWPLPSSPYHFPHLKRAPKTKGKRGLIVAGRSRLGPFSALRHSARRCHGPTELPASATQAGIACAYSGSGSLQPTGTFGGCFGPLSSPVRSLIPPVNCSECQPGRFNHGLKVTASPRTLAAVSYGSPTPFCSTKSACNRLLTLPRGAISGSATRFAGHVAPVSPWSPTLGTGQIGASEPSRALP